jgi:hypothetical protein
MSTTSRRTLFFTAACLAVSAALLPVLTSAARAEDMAKPAGDVVLTIDGAIGKKNAEGQADFDIEMLRAMPAVKIKTTTPWTEGVTEFEGVSLEMLFQAVEAKGKSIKATALNDYIADVDPTTITSSGAILAYRMNGADIAVRDKGPLWIMFPFDDKPQLKAETIYSQSVWQLRKMTFQE